MNDCLAVMYAAFQDAKSPAPSVLLIDEIDAVGRRDRFSGHNAAYSHKVVTGLLEALAGLYDRDGVVVVATTNNRENVDSALLRSGRLETHILVPLPDRDVPAEMLKLHLPSLADHPEIDGCR